VGPFGPDLALPPPPVEPRLTRVSRVFLTLAFLLSACGEAHSSPSGTDAEADTASRVDASDAAVDTSDRCCPLSPMGCCMTFGGRRPDSGECLEICDMIANDLEQRVDDAGCSYWYDPPGGTTSCNPGGPPDAGD